MTKKFGILFLFAFLLFSCENKYYYQEYVLIQEEKWNKDEPAAFTFSINDTALYYDFGFFIQYTEEYPMQNLYLFAETTFPNGMRTMDTLSCDLFALDGTALGKGNRIKELKIDYGMLKFPQQGKYVMKMKQGMRKDILDGVFSIGMFLKIDENQLNR